MKKYYLETLSVGCPKNILESASYRKTLEENGFEAVTTMDSADLVVLNTCGCLETLQNKAKVSIDTALEKQKTSPKKIVVAGCYPLIDKANNLKENQIESFPPGEILEFKKILKLSEEVKLSAETHQLHQEDISKQPKFVTSPSRYYNGLLKIEKALGFRVQPLHNFLKSIMMTAEFHYVILGKGCMGNCTFCGIKLAIGNPESRSMNEIINNVRKGVVNKKHSIWLVSDDVGCWGQDIGDNSANLLKEILAIPSPKMEIVINYFEPEMLLKYYEELKPSLIDPRVTQVCFPIQTGSQKLLKKMGRHYEIKEVLAKIDEIKKLHPRLVVKTQYITSFPGETWSDFFKSLMSMRHFHGIGVNSYARLKFTPAYKLTPNSEFITRTRKAICNVVVGFYHSVFVFKSLMRFDFENLERESR